MARAIIFREYGGADVLTLENVEAPKPGEGQVRVAVRAIGVNPMDVKIRRGDLRTVMPADFPVIPGAEVAGVVDEVGAGVTDVQVGDPVVAMTVGGAYTDEALATLALPKPDALSWTEAAAFPTVAGTAARCLSELDVAAGATLLVHGVAGSVGGVVAQLARSRGITVVGTARADDEEYVRGLGATPVTYGDNWVERVRVASPQGVDAVLDTAGAGVLPESISLMGGATDQIVTIADERGPSLGVRFSAGDPADTSPGHLPELLEAAARGELVVHVWRTFPLAEADRAQQAIEDHSARGKVVLLP